VLAAAVAPAPGAAPALDDAFVVLESMEAATARVRNYTMTLVAQEFFGDRLETEHALRIKWARPFSLYLKVLRGDNPGQEVLYSRGWNRDRMRVHKGSFPDLNFDLDPRGRLAMGHTHRPLSEGSLVHLVEMVLAGVRLARERGEGRLRLVAQETLFGRTCYRIEAESPPDWHFDTVGEDQTLWDVAARNGTEVHALLHANRERRWTRATSPRPGDRVRVPRYYAGRVELWVDRESRLPLKAQIYDHEGQLYERYEHRDLQVNVELSPLTFDPDNPEYDF